MDNKKFIQVNNLFFCYESESEDPVYALKDLNFSIGEGEFVAIVGRNGSGKSTLALNLNALLLPSSGSVLVDGIDTKDEEKVWEIRKRVGMVFQNPDNQLVSSVIEDDVAFGPENLGFPPEEIRTRVDEALKAVGMYEYRKKAPHLLSGGQKQRVAIAGVIAMRPRCIVFDESTAMLDPIGRREIMGIIESLHRSGHAIVLITHFMEEAARADRVIVMSEGSVVMDGTPAEIFEDQEKLEALDLEIPFAVKMTKALRKKGLKIPKDIVTEEQLAEALCALK